VNDINNSTSTLFIRIASLPIIFKQDYKFKTGHANIYYISFRKILIFRKVDL